MEVPPYGTQVNRVSFEGGAGITTFIWTGTDDDLYWLEKDMVHLSNKHCYTHAKALLSFTEKRE
jgi:hypothetical protein